MSITLPAACACGEPVAVVATEIVEGRLYVHAACPAHVYDGEIDSPECGGRPALHYPAAARFA